MKKIAILALLIFSYFAAHSMIGHNRHWKIGDDSNHLPRPKFKPAKISLSLHKNGQEFVSAYQQYLTQLIDEYNSTKLFQSLNAKENILIDYCLSRIVNNCCRFFKNSEFEKYKQSLEMLKLLLNRGQVSPSAKDIKLAIKCKLVHLVRLLAGFITSKDVLEKSFNYAMKKKVSRIRKIKKAARKRIKLEESALEDLYQQKYELVLIRQIILLLCIFNCSDEESIEYALDKKNPEFLKYLINKKAININDRYSGFIPTSGNYVIRITPLQYAVQNNNVPIVKTLLKNAAEPNCSSENTLPPLIRAVLNENYELLKLLLKYQADPNIKDFNGKSAFDYAIELGNQEIIDLLLWFDI